MSLNRNNTDLWKSDISKSVDFYNEWFLAFAPKTYRETRLQTTKEVESALNKTNNLLDLTPYLLSQNPSILPMLRMSTCPPIARDRLIGLAYTSPNLVKAMEMGRIPNQMNIETLYQELIKICNILIRLIDPDIFIWLETLTTKLCIIIK